MTYSNSFLHVHLFGLFFCEEWIILILFKYSVILFKSQSWAENRALMNTILPSFIMTILSQVSPGSYVNYITLMY